MKQWLALLCVALAGCGGPSSTAETKEIRIPKGAGGVGFLPLLVMEKYHLIEKHANVSVKWLDVGGPAVVNDALLSGSADFIAAGPPAFLTLWDRTRDSAKVTGVAALTSLPMYLNTSNPRFRSLEDLTPQDKIAVTAVKVSIPAIIMQMYASKKYGAAEATRFDKYTVSMTHPDGVVALVSGSGAITAHFTSPPFHQREIEDPRVHTVMNSDDVMGGSTTFTMVSTTSAFREKNPTAYAAVLAAIGEANELIIKDKKMAAQLLVASGGGGGLSAEKLEKMLQSAEIQFTTTPENTLKYAEFMHSIGSLKNRPTSWKDLFFPEIHGAPGS